MSGDRCILWMTNTGAPDPELLGALERKGLSVETSTNAFDAMARLCLASRPTTGTPRPTAAVLLLCDPERLHNAGEVARFAAKYAPKSKTWIFDSGTRRLRAATNEDTARWSGTEVRFGSAVRDRAASPKSSLSAEPQPLTRPPTPHTAPPPLRLSGRGMLPPSPDETTFSTPDKSPQPGTADGASTLSGLLTDEELAMLLSPDDPPRKN